MMFLGGFAIGLAIAGVIYMCWKEDVRGFIFSLENKDKRIKMLLKEIDEAGMKLAAGRKRTYLRKKTNKK